MSFALEVKQELCEKGMGRPCCMKAELAAFFLFGMKLHHGALRAVTEHTAVAQRLVMLLQKVFGIHARVRVHHGVATVYSITVERDVEKMFREFGIEEPFRLNYQLLGGDCCMHSFLRGVFLSCGSVTDPNKNYHAEFVTYRKQLGEDLVSVLSELGLEMKTTLRKSNYVIYAKSYEMIERLLVQLGATGAVLELENIQIVKEVNNASNRVFNCDMANVERTVTAAKKQRDAIRTLLDSGVPLSEGDRQLCLLRLEHDSANLGELGAMMDPPLSKSGVNHRMRKLMRLAEEQKGS